MISNTAFSLAATMIAACVILPISSFAQDLPQNVPQQDVLQDDMIPHVMEPPRKDKLDDKQIVSFVLENDLFTGTDRYYTNGVRFAYLTEEQRAPQWVQNIAQHLPFSKKRNYRISMAFGQNMYVPTSIETPNPSPDDRPYAGWLYGSVGLVSDSGEVLRTALLTVGMVGPASLAEHTQKFVHEIVNSPKPLGWDHQLKNEPGIILTLEQKWRNLYQIAPMGIEMDATPHVGINLGNINTDAIIGTTFRIGYDLPADYGPPRIRPSLPGSDFFIPNENLSGYLFAGVEGRGVARNIFLDGNSFRDSPSVDKRYWIGSAQLGAAVTYRDVRISYTHVFQSKEFKTQLKAAQFGAVTISTRF